MKWKRSHTKYFNYNNESHAIFNLEFHLIVEATIIIFFTLPKTKLSFQTVELICVSAYKEFHANFLYNSIRKQDNASELETKNTITITAYFRTLSPNRWMKTLFVYFFNHCFYLRKVIQYKFFLNTKTFLVVCWHLNELYEHLTLKN